MVDKVKMKTIVVIAIATCLNYHPTPPTSILSWCDCFVYDQASVSLLHTQIQAGRQSNTGAHQRNGLSHPPLRTLWLQTSFTHPCDDLDFKKVSTVRAYCIPPPHNIK